MGTEGEWESVRCTALTKAGRRCRAWAVRGSRGDQGEPRCVVHGGGGGPAAGPAGGPVARSGGVPLAGPARYSRYFFDSELMDLASPEVEALSLEGEIAYARVFLSRLLAAASAQPALDISQYDRLVPHVVSLLRAVRELVAEQRAAREEENPLEVILDEALDELGEEWGLPL